MALSVLEERGREAPAKTCKSRVVAMTSYPEWTAIGFSSLKSTLTQTSVIGGVPATTSSMLYLRLAFLFLLAPTCILNIYLYLYPVLKSCDFPSASSSSALQSGFRSLPLFSRRNGASQPQAPFRLLAFGDPQLEGDTSLQFSTSDKYHPSVFATNLRQAATLSEALSIFRQATLDFFTASVPSRLRRLRKRLDLVGNDYYLAHIYRTVRRHAQPTHVAILGDLLGSQWIDDAEFERRSVRFWQRVFRGGRRVEHEITSAPTIEPLGEDKGWHHRVINVAGNHDVGYAGDMTEARLERFEGAFGRANWEIVFSVSPTRRASEEASGIGTEEMPDAFLRLVILNSMNLDTPAKSTELQTATYAYLNDVIGRSQPVEDRRVGTILLTHIPLYKDAGVCTDGPLFEFHGEHDGGGVKEQNHLSYDASRGGILEGLYGMSGNAEAPFGGMGRQGLVLTGHDHEGCDVYHHLPLSAAEREVADDQERRWNATRWEHSQESRTQPIPGIREVTLRSMMGEFGGLAYFISAWFEEGDNLDGTWKFEVARCAIGIQHWWWAGHILMVITVGVGLLLAALTLFHGASLYQEIKVGKGKILAPRKQESSPTQLSKASGFTAPQGNGHITKRRQNEDGSDEALK